MIKDSLLPKGLKPLSLPDFSGIEAEQLVSVLKKCEQGRGEEVLKNFEDDFKKLVQSDYCIPVSSATSGLHLALLALGIAEDDEVICPTFTFAASAFPILYQKAIPVFVDSDEDSWNISPEHLESAIKARLSAGKKPKAIIIVHSYGNPAQLNLLLNIASNYKIPIIEDAANALGSTFNQRQVGTFGSIGVFSFNRNKIISGGAGGCVVTHDSILADKMRYFAHQAKSKQDYYHHEEVGYNYGLSPVLAEIIRIQLTTLQARIKKRKAVFQEYFHKYNPETTFQKEIDNAFSNRWLTVLKFKEPKISSPEYHHVWKPLHTQPVFNRYPYFGNKESEGFFENGICLPFSK